MVKMELFNRVKEIAKHFTGSDKALAEKLGFKQATFSGYLNEKRQDNLWPLLPNILSLFPSLSRDWLYFGEGPMLKTDAAESPSPNQSPAQTDNSALLELLVRNKELEEKVFDLKGRLADKEKLIARILETVAATESFLLGHSFSLQSLIDAKDFEKLQQIQTAANAVSATIEEKKTFLTYASELSRLMKYTDRGDIAPEVRTRYEAITAIYGELKKKRKTASNVDLMVEINNIISEYVHVEDAASGMVLSRQFDISQIDFDLLRREFAKTKKKNLVMKDLAELIRSRLDSMLLNNPDRIIYHERYQQIIEDYNSQQDRATIEKTFDELMQIVKDMDQEERRYVREGFSSDEELSLYDMLFSENLSKPDIRKIKAVAVELLQKVKSKIAELDHWTDKQETRSIVYNLIRDDLWSELPACYDDPSIPVYLQRIYEYVYKRYKEVA